MSTTVSSWLNSYTALHFRAGRFLNLIAICRPGGLLHLYKSRARDVSRKGITLGCFQRSVTHLTTDTNDLMLGKQSLAGEALCRQTLINPDKYDVHALIHFSSLHYPHAYFTIIVEFKGTLCFTVPLVAPHIFAQLCYKQVKASRLYLSASISSQMRLLDF